MQQMEVSTLSAARNEAQTQTYNISSDDMDHLKDKIVSLEAQVQVISKSVSDIKGTLDMTKPTPVVL